MKYLFSIQWKEATDNEWSSDASEIIDSDGFWVGNDKIELEDYANSLRKYNPRYEFRVVPNVFEFERIIKEQDELIKKLQEALIWCSGSNDFGPEGIAHEGWLKVRPLIVAEVSKD